MPVRIIHSLLDWCVIGAVMADRSQKCSNRKFILQCCGKKFTEFTNQHQIIFRKYFRSIELAPKAFPTSSHQPMANQLIKISVHFMAQLTLLPQTAADHQDYHDPMMVFWSARWIWICVAKSRTSGDSEWRSDFQCTARNSRKLPSWATNHNLSKKLTRTKLVNENWKL